jgi:hypothetical protein
MAANTTNNNHEKPTLRHTKQGGLYAKPRDILTSKNAQKQLRYIRNSPKFKARASEQK